MNFALWSLVSKYAEHGGMPVLVTAFGQALAFMPELLVFRCLPYAIYASCSARQSKPIRVVAAGIYTLLVVLVIELTPDVGSRLGLMTVGMAYYALAACAICYLGPALIKRWSGHGAAFALCVFAFMVLPVLLHAGLATSPPLALGWELALGAYSYAAETARSRTERSVRDCWFFLFLEQTLVFSLRREPWIVGDSRWPGLARALLGAAVLCVGLMLQFAGLRSVLSGFFADVLPNAYVAAVSYGCVLFCIEYAGHSGRASLSIGTMRMLGFRLPERYHYPFLASSPEEFWRRWNRYVGTWFRVYVYLPMSRRLMRRDRTWSGAVMASLLATFALIGLLHDVDTGVRQMHFKMHWVFGFTLIGAAVLAGNAIRRPLLRSARSWRFRRIFQWAAHLTMLHLIGATAWMLLH